MMRVCIVLQFCFIVSCVVRAGVVFMFSVMLGLLKIVCFIFLGGISPVFKWCSGWSGC